jgi:hypothetical protein
MMEFQEWEAEGYFGLSYGSSACVLWDDSLGRGGELTTCRFTSSEARSYFKQAREYEEAANRAGGELAWMRRKLEEIVKRRNVRAEIRKLLGDKKA